MMDDATINRLVAERVLGWVKVDGYEKTWRTPADRIMPLRDYCNDPAAWGELFTLLMRAGLSPSIEGRYPEIMGDEAVEALLYYHPSAARPDSNRVADLVASAYDAKPGRALALAALKAHGMEVGE